MMKLCLAQINTTIGHFDQNAEKILAGIRYAQENLCDLVVFPELCLFGYWPSDLLDQKDLVEKQIQKIKEIHKQVPKGLGVLFGCVSFASKKSKDTKSVIQGRRYQNTALFLEKGKKPQVFAKELLPNYDIFDELRHFTPGKIQDNILKFKNKKILVTICEDIWAWDKSTPQAQLRYSQNPISQIKAKFDLVVNLSASPYSYGKIKEREFVVAQTARHLKSPMVYVNQSCTQDEVIFDGGSFAVDSKGQKIFQMPYFEEKLDILDLKLKGSKKQKFPKISSLQLLKRALVSGIKDFVTKNNFKKIHLGLSGGIDSALVAALAVEAVGAKNVVCIALPGPYSSQLSFDLALRLTENLKCEFLNVDINGIYKTFFDELDISLGIKEFGLVHENLQSRIRGNVLMAYSNFRNSLLLTTGNKAEYAMGYATLYGDMCGGLAPLGDLLKSQVIDLCKWINKEKEVIPVEIIDRPPTAELRENQKDEDSLPPYKILDPLVEKFIVRNETPKNETEKNILDRMMRAEFKRWQSPPILRVSDKAFGSGRKYPISKKM